MNRLPRTACIYTTPEQRTQEVWTVETELLALLVEINSVGASGKQIKKPISVPRPKHIKRSARDHQYSGKDAALTTGPDPFKQGVAVLMATTRGAVKR